MSVCHSPLPFGVNDNYTENKARMKSKPETVVTNRGGLVPLPLWCQAGLVFCAAFVIASLL